MYIKYFFPEEEKEYFERNNIQIKPLLFSKWNLKRSKILSKRPTVCLVSSAPFQQINYIVLINDEIIMVSVYEGRRRERDFARSLREILSVTKCKNVHRQSEDFTIAVRRK